MKGEKDKEQVAQNKGEIGKKRKHSTNKEQDKLNVADKNIKGAVVKEKLPIRRNPA